MSGVGQDEGMTRYRARAVLMLFLVLHLTACTSWQSVSLDAISPAQLIEEDRPDRVRVLIRSGRQAELERPVVDGGLLVAPGVSMPLADIVRLEIRKISLVRSALAGFGIFVGGIILIQFVECGVDGTWAC